jgi:hypothetical protein
MDRKHPLATVSVALVASLLALVASAAVQGVFFFRRSLQEFGQPRLSAVRDVCPIGPGQAGVLFTVVPDLEKVGLHQLLGIYDESAHCMELRPIELDIVPWLIGGSASSEKLLVVTREGRLYSMDTHCAASSLQCFGFHEPSPPHMLECSEDGSLVVVASVDIVSAWDTRQQKLLWRRTGLATTAGTFVAGSHRFICGLECGTMLELDLRTGATLRTVATAGNWVNGLTVSSCQTYLAAIDSIGRLSMHDFRTGRELWSRDCAVLLGGKPVTPPVTPRFVPGQEAIVVAYALRGKRLAVHAAATGRQMVEFEELAGGDVKGLEVTPNGLAYVWDDAGSVIVWDVNSGKVRHRFSPERAVALWSVAAGAFPTCRSRTLQ